MALSRSSASTSNVNYTWTPRYTTLRGETEMLKQKAGVTVKPWPPQVAVCDDDRLLLSASVAAAAWDPDFTYGFGYFDWHPRTFSLQHNNYAGNRYPCAPRRARAFVTEVSR